MSHIQNDHFGESMYTTFREILERGDHEEITAFIKKLRDQGADGTADFFDGEWKEQIEKDKDGRETKESARGSFRSYMGDFLADK